MFEYDTETGRLGGGGSRVKNMEGRRLENMERNYGEYGRD